MGNVVVGVDIIDWIQRVGAQIWPNRVRGEIKSWTVQVFTHGQVIQPTRATFLAAVADAIREHEALENGLTGE